MPGNTIGEAWVVVRPETTAFTSELQGGLAPGLATAAKAFLALGAVAVGVGVIAVKMAGDFQQATTQLITGAGESVKNIAMIRAGLLAMAPAVGIGPVALAKALYMIESAGYHGAAGLHLLQIAAEGAKVGNADLTVVADALTSALNAYHLPASAAVSVTNQIIAAVSVGKVHMQDFAQAIGAILAPAAAANISFAEVSAAISTMTMQGTDANRAAQSLRFVIASLQGPTAAAAKEMAGLGVGEAQIPGITAAASAELAKLGLHTSEVAYTLTHQGLLAALQMITDAIGKQFPAGSAQYNAALRAATGGTRGFTAALELSGANAVTYQKNIAAVTAAAHAAGTTVKGWALVQTDFNTKLDQLNAAVQVAFVRLGTWLIPIVQKVVVNIVPVITQVYNWITSLHGLWVTTGQVFTAIAQIVGNVTAWIRQNWGTIATVTSIAWTIITTTIRDAWITITTIYHVGLTIMIALWSTVWKVFSTVVGTAVTIISTTIGVIVNAVKLVISWVGGPLSAIFGTIGNVGRAVFGGIATAIGWVVNAIGTLIGWIRTAIGWFTSLGNASGSAVRPPGSPIIGRRAAGGPVDANVPYWVGESGPEIFKPRTSGVVIPTSALTSGMGRGTSVGAAAIAGASSIVQNFTINGGDPAEIRRVVGQENRKLVLALKAR